tara:strand:+ start:5653 stop:7095 length:1443 start_codon:yes stop_codon:yes gene_type:complete
MPLTLLREKIPESPDGWTKLRWFGPGLLWMLSAVGTGSILFTPRVAAAYEYQLLWLLLIIVFFMWIMIREMARFSIATGKTMLQGMYTLDGPKGWAVWFILLPQLLAAAVGIAGLSGVVGSALQGFLPGGTTLYGILLVVLCTAFVATGKYGAIERLSRILALALMIMVIVSAAVVSPDLGNIADGIRPSWPAQADLYIVLPWVGTILAGSMGIVWFGYWTATRGFGGGLESSDQDEECDATASEQHDSPDNEQEKIARIKAWVSVMTGTATLGVVGGLSVISAFMILGAELLAPQGAIPQGTDVAVDLTRLFSDVWGQAGEYLLLAAIIIALGGSVLANQDGWGRSFADITLILTRDKRRSTDSHRILDFFERTAALVGIALFQRRHLKRLFIVIVTGVIPVCILLAVKDPVQVMSASGIIAAMHTPFIALVSLYVNRTRLPAALRPNLISSGAMAVSGLFYMGFATLYVWDLVANSHP